MLSSRTPPSLPHFSARATCSGRRLLTARYNGDSSIPVKLRVVQMNVKPVTISPILFSILFIMPGELMAEGSRQNAEIIIPEQSRPYYEDAGYAPAIRVGDTIYVSGVIVSLRGEGSYEERYARGYRATLEWIETVLIEAGASLDDVIDITTFHTDLQRQLETAVEVNKQIMAMPHPAWTAVGTTALASPDGVTEIKVVAALQ